MSEKICDNCMSKIPAQAGKCPRCGIRFENTNPGGALPMGFVLGGRYTVGQYIDIDGEGVTYAAIDAHTLQRVKIKEYMPVTLCATRNGFGEIVPKPGCEVLFKTTRMDFTDLYVNLQRVGFAEGLVQVLDVVEENNTVYAVQEKIEGQTLAEYLMRAGEPIDAVRAQAILRPVLMGVDTLHKGNIIHRGVCPENIIMESGGSAKLTGYATLALRQQGSELKPKLYPGYSAPEQYSASEFEGTYTDIYALGAVLFTMVTGEKPFSADERAIQDLLRPAKSVNKEVPAYLSAAVARTLRLTPGERIQTIADFRLVLSGEGDIAKRKGKDEGLFGLTKKQTIIGISALGAVALILVIVLIFALFNNKNKANPISTSSEAISQVEEGKIPKFVGLKYETVINNKTYTDVFDFAEPEYEYNDEHEEGIIISQTPQEETDYTIISSSKQEIELVVSKGREPVAMPDFVSAKTMRDVAIAKLNELEIKYIEISKSNDGTYEAGQVISTEPKAGELVVPGKKDAVTLYVASKATAVKMPAILGKDEASAKSEMDSAGIKYSVNYVNTDYKNKLGTIISASYESGAMVPDGTTVTLNVAKTHVMPDVSSSFNNKNADELKNYLTERGIPYQTTNVATPDQAKNGTIERVVQPATNSPLNNDSVVMIYVYMYEAPPATP